MGEVLEHLEPLSDDRMTAAAVHVDDEADAAGVVLIGRVVKPLRGGQAG
jgi:hypothetical protein